MTEYDITPCSKCGSTKTVKRIIKDWGNESHYRYSVLAQCSNDRCSWNDCVMHIDCNAVNDTPPPTVPVATNLDDWFNEPVSGDSLEDWI